MCAFDHHASPRRPLAGVASRRRVLGLGVSGLSAALLVACGKGGDDAATPTASAATGGTSPTAAATAAGTSAASATASASAAATSSAAAGTVSAKALTAAQAFLGTLDATQKATVVADRTQANLSQWSNLPDQAYKRGGVRMDGLSAAQQTAALGILQAVLSQEGFTQVQQITTADGVLASTSNGGGGGFGADRYYVRFVGTPSATTPWTLQYGGHHLAVNVTMDGSKVTMAPTLWGSQPSMYAQNGATIEPLGGEVAKAFALMNALDGSQQTATMVSARDLVLGPGQDGKTLPAAGLKASTMTNAQKQLLLALVQEWLRPLNAESIAARMAAAESELDATLFGWNGQTAVGQAVYYRVQSPSAVIEFAHQSMGGNSVNHIHSIYREIGNDYGGTSS